MTKLYVQNLKIIITNDDNLNPPELVETISDETIDNLFDQISIIGNLYITGGEPLLHIEKIKKIYQKIIDRGIIIDEFGICTNGTYFDSYVDRLFDVFSKYSRRFSDSFKGKKTNLRNKGYYDLNYNKGLLNNVKFDNLALYEQYQLNIKDLKHSKYFLSMNERDKEINHQQIELSNQFILNKQDYFYVGPVLTIDQYGNVLETNEIFHNEIGNVNEDDLLSIVYRNAIECKTIHKWNKSILKELKKVKKNK